MKNKYEFIGGFTVSDNYEMKRLRRLAKKGWILEDIVSGMFYKFRKDKPEDIYYNVDYNQNADKKYFNEFESKGWKKVLSFDNTMHIFLSKKDSKFVSSSLKIDRFKLIHGIIKKQLALWAVIDIIVLALIAVIMYASLAEFLPLLFLFIIPFIKLFATTFEYYVSKEKIKVFNKYGKGYKDSIANNKMYAISQAFTAVLFLVLGIVEALNSGGLTWIFWIIACLVNVYSSIKYYKKYKKSIESLQVFR